MFHRAAHIRPGKASQDCSDCPIKDRAVCAYSTRDEIERLNLIKSYRTYAPGASILAMGEPATFVGSVVSGIATLSETLADGRMQVTGLLMPSDFIGRSDRSIASFDVVAVDEVVLCCFDRKSFAEQIAASPALGRRLLEMTMDELDVAREWMLLLGRKTAREKLASALLILARRTMAVRQQGLTNGTRIAVPLTREALANYLGLTIETVSRQMTQLRNDGVIHLDGARDVVILDLQALTLASGVEPTLD